MQAGADRATPSRLRLGRRCLTASVAALAVARQARADAGQAALNLPRGNAIGFRILRDGSEVGTHRVAFDRRGDTTVVQVAIDIAVTYGWITMFRFTHRAVETWQGERFSGIGSHTDENGRAAWMRTVPDPGGALLVSGSGTVPYAAPPGALASTYWNPAILGAPVISSQDGRLSAPRVEAGPLEPVPCVGGTVQARRHDMHGDRDLQIWYDLDDQWAHFRFQRDGSLITYLRT
jgi:hypothetical protein